MKKHIVYKIAAFPTVSETFVVQNMIQTIESGFDVSIISNKINPSNLSSQPALLEKYALMERLHRFSEPKASIFRTLRALFILLNPVLFYHFLNYSKLKKRKSLSWVFLLNFYRKYRNVNCVHIHFANVINPLLDLKRIGFIKSKLMVSFHGFDAHRLKKGDELDRLIADYKKYVNYVTVNSNYLKNILIEKGFPADYIRIVPIGVDTSQFEGIKRQLPTKDQTFKIISVGRLIKLKGHHLGIRAVKKLHDEGYKVNYSIVGEGEERENLEKLIAELDLQEVVYLVGKKSQAEIKELLLSHHLFLMTSTFDGKRREAYGVVSLEAQAMGLPVIAFDSGGVADTITNGSTGYVLKENDIDEMSAKVKLLMNDQDQYQLMSKNAIEITQKNFDITQTIGRYIKLYSA